MPVLSFIHKRYILLRSQTKLGSGFVKLAALCMKITVDLKNTHFIKNVGGLGASIFIFVYFTKYNI